ncbi:glycosyltransferase [Picrophilus oshimae]|nr:glycosyltransferase [Picrophilus oshimae]
MGYNEFKGEFSKILGINVIHSHAGIGVYSEKLQKAMGINLISIPLDKNKSKLQYPGRIIYPEYPKITSGWLLNSFKTGKYIKNEKFSLLHYTAPILKPIRDDDIVTFHDLYMFEKKDNEGIAKKLDKLYLRRIINKYKNLNILSISNETTMNLIDAGFNEDKITTVYNYIDPIFSKRNIKKIENSILTVGDDWWKNSEKIDKIVHGKYYHIHVGRNRADLNYVDVTPEEMVNIYNQAEVLVRMNKFEGFGYPPLESLFCGTPVVTSDLGIYHETLNDSAIFSGFDDLIKNIGIAMDQRDKLLSNFEKIKDRYTIETYKRKMSEFYSNLL